ncbi:MAG TPA: phosphoribosylglycinamide formyltransferase [Phycisphaerae bacterium]|nr:phosphoribosylglycinamide formyltransferase [Phycisphaerae bacterium]
MSETRGNASDAPLRIGALVSGGGRTVLNIAEHVRTHALNASIAVVISSRKNAPAIERCRAVNLDVEVVQRSGQSQRAFDKQIAEILKSRGCDLVCMCGFYSLWTIPPEFAGRVVNIHPALLPSFGGKGFYGDHVHRAVLQAGEKVSGCTVHYADNEYDHGPILLQESVAVAETDDVDTLASKVFETECIAYPQAIAMLTDGRAPLPHPDLAAMAHSNPARTD